MKELASIGKNTAWQILGKGMGTLISIITIFFIIRLLGPNNYGLFALLITIMNMFYMLGGLGTESSVAYFLSKYKKTQFDLIKKFLKARGALIALSSIILLLSINFISDYYNNPGLKNYLPFIALALPFFVLMDLGPHIFQGLNNLKASSISELIFNIAKISAIPLIIFFSIYGGIMGYIIAYICYCLYAYKKIVELSKGKNENFGKYGEFAKFSLINYAATISLFLSGNLLQLILGKNPAQLGYLDASMRIGMIMTLIPQSLLTAFIPGIIGKKTDEIKKISSKIINYILIAIIPLFLFFFFVPGFAAKIILGSEFFGITSIIKVASAISFLSIFSGFFESLSFSMGKNKYNLMGYLIRLAVIILFANYAVTAINTSIILLIAGISVFLFMSLIVRKYYKINCKNFLKVMMFSLPLALSFALDMNIILKILLSITSSALYLYLVWFKALDDIDRDLFKRFALKLKSIAFKSN